jgi:hypothetical protein
MDSFPSSIAFKINPIIYTGLSFFFTIVHKLMYLSNHYAEMLSMNIFFNLVVILLSGILDTWAH